MELFSRLFPLKAQANRLTSGVTAGSAVALTGQQSGHGRRVGNALEMVVGRSRSQQLVLRDLEVSTSHAKIGLGVGGSGMYLFWTVYICCKTKEKPLVAAFWVYF